MLLNQHPADPDDYIEALEDGDLARFGVQNLADINADIIGIQTNVLATKTGSLGTTIRFGPRHGGFEDTGDYILAQEQFQYRSRVSEVNPSTGQPWEIAEVNSTEISLERVS